MNEYYPLGSKIRLIRPTIDAHSPKYIGKVGILRSHRAGLFAARGVPYMIWFPPENGQRYGWYIFAAHDDVELVEEGHGAEQRQPRVVRKTKLAQAAPSGQMSLFGEQSVDPTQDQREDVASVG